MQKSLVVWYTEQTFSERESARGLAFRRFEPDTDIRESSSPPRAGKLTDTRDAMESLEIKVNCGRAKQGVKEDVEEGGVMMKKDVGG